MKDVNDINKILPKIPNMRWGALMNKAPTNQRIKEMEKMFPDNGKWHTIFDEKDQVIIDGKRVWKQSPERWT
jgi:hypothetical protein